MKFVWVGTHRGGIWVRPEDVTAIVSSDGIRYLLLKGDPMRIAIDDERKTEELLEALA